MTDEPKRKGKVISLGWAKPDYPIYQEATWDLVIGAFLSPSRSAESSREDEAPPEPSAPNS